MPELPHHKAWLHPKQKQYQPPSAGRAADYAELQVTSNFSFLRGASHPEELIERAAQLQYRAIAITDHHTMAGMVRAHLAAKQLGIRLVVGSQLPLYEQFPDIRTPTENKTIETTPIEGVERLDLLLPFSLLLYPVDARGYGRLCKLLTRGKLRAPKGNCFLNVEDVAYHSDHLLAVVVCRDLAHPALSQHLTKLVEIFDNDRLSLAVGRSYGPDADRGLRCLLELSRQFSIPLVATNDVHYHIPERRKLQDVLTCIRLGKTLDEAGYALAANAERYLKKPQEMARLWRKLTADAPHDPLARTLEIAERCSGFSLDQLQYQYPHEICPAGKTPLQYLSELTWEGAAYHYPQGVPPAVKAQLEHELRLISELQYEKYFLTVYDIVLFARSQGILCQGRGAAANSAVCYCLGVTAVDPDKINLLFERFVSKERNEPPDIDIDFEHERREEVIQYIYSKYGRSRAALVAEVISYRTRSALRDVGKAVGLEPETIELLVRLVTRSEDRQLSPEQLQSCHLNPNDPKIINTLHLGQTLLGFPRHLSQHVGGFIISEQELSELVPIENATMPERTVIEWDKDDVDSMGMLKVDVLGLGMLTCIRKTFNLVNDRRAEEEKFKREELMLHTIPPEDPAVYDMICQADTIGVFQIESRAQMSMLPRLRPRCFYDLVIEVAIVRPGPIQGGMIHPFLRRRSGEEKVSYPDSRIEKILVKTLGVPIFQEQVMELAVVAAGFTAGEADQLRRAMASWRKNKNLLAAFGSRLINGMLSNGYSKQFALSLFEQIKGFGEYGFPQSHSASFALLVYVSAWLKKHHPAAFAAGLLNSQPMGFYQPSQIVDCAKRHDVEVRAVDVNFSKWDCTLEGPGPALRLGLRLVKGLREQDGNLLAACVGQNGSYRSIKALWRDSGVRVASLRQLAKADAFTSMGLSRQRALWAIRKLRDEKLPLFDGSEEGPKEKDKLPVILPQIPAELSVLSDYRSIGLSLKAHPLSFLRPALSQRGAVTSYDLRHNDGLQKGARVSVAGLVTVRQRPSTARGIIFMTIEDETGSANLIVKPEVLRRYINEVCDSVIVFVSGRLQRAYDVVNVVVEEVADWSNALPGFGTQSRDFR